jgi:hypothetical protein
MKGIILCCEWYKGGGFYTAQWKINEDYRFFFKDKLLYISKYKTVELEDDREEYIETLSVSDTFELELTPTTGGLIKPEMNLYISFTGENINYQKVLEQAEKIESFFNNFLD